MNSHTPKKSEQFELFDKPEEPVLPNEPTITKSESLPAGQVLEHHEQGCQYCEDVGPCMYCKRGHKEAAQRIKDNKTM